MRQGISKKHQLVVWRRDFWTCRYCSEAVFFMPLLKVLEELNPGHGYYHKNGKAGAVLDIFQWKWATVDHIVPVSFGGQNSLDNYVTACWKCNLTINDKYEDKTKPKPVHLINKNMNWDGFSGLYLKLGPKNDWHRLLSAIDNH